MEKERRVSPRFVQRKLSRSLFSAFATRLCTNESKWENKSNYALCIGCSSVNRANSVKTARKIFAERKNFLFQSFNTEFSLPNGYILARRYFVVCANGISVVLLAFGILILLGNRFSLLFSFRTKTFVFRCFLKSIEEMFEKYSSRQRFSRFSHSIDHSNLHRTSNDAWLFRAQRFRTCRRLQFDDDLFQRRHGCFSFDANISFVFTSFTFSIELTASRLSTFHNFNELYKRQRFTLVRFL